MTQGTVRFFNEDEGYGMIAIQDSQDAFVHYSSIQEDEQVLKEGQRVEFELGRGQKGPQAEYVRVLR